MKYILIEQDKNRNSKCDVLKIKTLKGDSRIFHFKTIIENIIEYQCKNKLTFGNKWIDENKYNNFKFNLNDYIIDLSMLEICLTSVSADIFAENINKDSLIKIQIELETEDEINMYLKLFINESYDVQQPISGIVNIDYERALCASPYINFEINELTEVGDYIVFIALIKKAIIKKYEKWFYVIRKDQLNDNIIVINCYSNLIPHIIGKGGKNINKLKEKIYQKGFDKVKRIEVIPVVE